MAISSKISNRFSSLNINWQAVKKAATFIFFIVLAVLLVNQAKELEWQKIWTTFKETETKTLVIAGIIGLLSYTAYASYDLIGRYLFNTHIRAYKTMLVAWVSYALNLNLGALVGSIAMRYRMYYRLGVDAKTTTKIISVSVFSNWAGYIMLAGLLFTSGAFSPPESWFIGDTGIRILGIAFLCLIGAYIAICTLAKKREFEWRGQQIILPRWPILLWQLTTATIHWTLMALVMYQFFSDQLDFATVYIALMVSCIAGALAHVPGGLGVIEAVFVALISGVIPKHEIIAGVFAYRCVFYFLPLLLAIPLYFGLETVLLEKKSTDSK